MTDNETTPTTDAVELQADTSKMTFADLEFLAELQDHGESIPMSLVKPMVAMLDRLIVGGVRHLPVSEMPNVIAALSKQTEAKAKN